MGTTRRKKKKAPVRRRRKTVKKRNFPFRLLSFVLLFMFLVFSMGAAGYVIFFRTTIAYGATGDGQGEKIVFEEPYSSLPAQPAKISKVYETSLPMVAIIIDDMGYNKKTGLELLDLPMNLSFSFLAAAPYARELEERAYQLGRVILLHLPMEPKSKEWNPGPGALLVSQSKDEQARLLNKNLLGVPHAVGVNNHMGSRYTENSELMDSLMELLAEQKLFFVDSFTTVGSKGDASASKADIPTARRDIFLDNVQSQDKVCSQLHKLVLRAEKQGEALGIGHPNGATLAALANCWDKYKTRVRLVSAQELVMSLWSVEQLRAMVNTSSFQDERN